MLEKQNSLDWRIWLQMFTHRWYLPAITCFLAIVFGLYKAYTTPPEYESSSTVMILDTDLLSGSTLRFVPGAPKLNEIEYFRQRIMSVDFMKKLLENYNVIDKPAVKERIAELSAESPEIPRDEISEIVCIEYLQEKITTRKRAYNIIELGAREESATEAYVLASLFTNLAISESQESQMQFASLARVFSTELLETYKKRLNDAEDRLESFKNGTLQELPVESRLDEEKLREIESNIFSIQIEIGMSQA